MTVKNSKSLLFKLEALYMLYVTDLFLRASLNRIFWFMNPYPYHPRIFGGLRLVNPLCPKVKSRRECNVGVVLIYQVNNVVYVCVRACL